MPARLTRQTISAFATALGVFTALGAGTVSDTLQEWHFGLGASFIALIVWIINRRKYRALADTPRAPISSAPQGYIEIEGIGKALDGLPLLSPLNHLPCLWYHVIEETRRNQEWEKSSEETSDASFVLEGEDGAHCYVDPENASVTAQSKDVVTNGDTRITQWMLIPGTRIHALGHFLTHSQTADRPSLNDEIRDKLADWKATGEAMRFDHDKDGELDMKEWELARAAARKEVEQDRTDAASMPDTHRMIAPSDGRSFIITDMDSDRLARRYRYGSWGALLVFFIALYGTAWLWSHRATL